MFFMYICVVSIQNVNKESTMEKLSSVGVPVVFVDVLESYWL
jgi:hypothetical protein